MKKVIALVLCMVMLSQITFAESLFSINSISAGAFDIVFAIDNSESMYHYDYALDNGWFDAFYGLMEQSPSGSNFAVVTQDGTRPFANAETAEDYLYDIPVYHDEVSASSLLQSAANLLSERENQKMVVLSTASCYNNSGLVNKITELSNQGIMVYVIAFEKDTAKAESIKDTYNDVIVCASTREVAIRMGELYQYMAESNTPQMYLASADSTESEATYNSAFRTGKHNYSIDTTGPGASLIQLLNMYYLLPTYTDSYQLSYKQCDEATKGNTHEMFTATDVNDEVLKCFEFWDSKAKALFANAYFASSGNIKTIVGNNLKKRYPVLVRYGTDTYGIVTKVSGDTCYLNGSNDSADSVLIDQIVTVVDTSKYLGMILFEDSITEEFTFSTGELTISLPEAYVNGQVAKNTGSGWTVIKSPEDTNNKIVLYPVNNTSLIVALKTDFVGVVPTCINSTLKYTIKMYSDMKEKHWADAYVFDMTNKGILQGDTEGTFRPDEPVKIGEFLKIIIEAADIHREGDWEAEENEPWPINYIEYMENTEIAWPYPIDCANEFYGIDSFEELIKVDKDLSGLENKYYDNFISREFAFYLLWQVATLEDCRTPNTLKETSVDSGEILKGFGDYNCIYKRTDFDGFEKAIANLVKNNVVAGYIEEDGINLHPYDTITRSEACKIVSVGMFTLNPTEKYSSVELNYNNYEFDLNTSGETIVGSIIENNDVVPLKTNDYGSLDIGFEIPTGKTGLYPIKLAENSDNRLNLKVYDDEYNIIYPKSGKYDASGNECYYPLLENQQYVISVHGPSDIECEFRIGQRIEGNTERTEKEIHIVLYDSPDVNSLLDCFISEQEKIGKFYTKDSNLGSNRYLNSSENKYEYTVEFFEKYLKVLGNNNVVFSINIRDVDFDENRINYGNEEDWDIPYENLEEWNDFITPRLADMIYNICCKIKCAYNNIKTDTNNIVMPKVCIGTPHFEGRFYGYGYTDIKRNEFADKYLYYTKMLYDDVVTNLGNDDMIYGLYFGKEDPLSVIPPRLYPDYSVPLEADTEYLTMKKVAQFIHGENKKHVWMPYTAGEKNTLKNIGIAANTGIYNGTDGLSHDIFDVVIIQPGFYFKETHALDLSDVCELNLMQRDTLKSIEENKVMIYNDGDYTYTPQNGGKLTDTTIGFQIEFDGGFYTGRWNSLELDDKYDENSYEYINGASTPSEKAERFSTTVKTFYPLIYDSVTTFGIYAGGPNEQGYIVDGETGEKKNDNSHSNNNHITLLKEDGDKVKYHEFWTYLTESQYNNSETGYNGALIFDTISGVLDNTWATDARNYFKGLFQFSSNGQIIN